jgi:hypothetical protein
MADVGTGSCQSRRQLGSAICQKLCRDPDTLGGDRHRVGPRTVRRADLRGNPCSPAQLLAPPAGGGSRTWDRHEGQDALPAFLRNQGD